MKKLKKALIWVSFFVEKWDEKVILTVILAEKSKLKSHHFYRKSKKCLREWAYVCIMLILL